MRCVYLAVMPQLIFSFYHSVAPKFRALLLVVLSIIFFVASWPGTGELWAFVFVAFVPLFALRRMVVDGKLSSLSYSWFMVLAFFGWNVGTVFFVFNVEAHFGIKLLSLLTPVLINTIWMTGAMLAFHWSAKRMGVRLALIIFVLLWLTVEWGQHHWSLAFPWLTLGNVMAPHPEWIQWYSVTGVAGGSLWVLAVNALLADALFGKRAQKRNLLRLVLPIALFLLPMSLRWLTAEAPNNGEEGIRYTIVQPCLDLQSEKFESDLLAGNISSSLQLIDKTNRSPGIVVLPETFLFEKGLVSGPVGGLRFSGLWMDDVRGSESVHQLRNFIDSTAAQVVIAGAFVNRFYDREVDFPAYARIFPEIGGAVEQYNSAVILTDSVVQMRHKTMLVAGVERIPFAETLPFLNDLALDFGGVVGSLGINPAIRSVRIQDHEAGVQICYDSAFGWLSRELVRDGAEVLVIITNDAWWGNTPGHRQLLSFAQLRAIETGRPVVRSANNGISAFISAHGEIQNQLPWDVRGTISGEVSPASHLTWYTKHGDFIYRWSAFSLPLLFLLGMLATRFSKPTSRFG